MERIKAGGIIQRTNLVEIGVMSVPDRPGIASTVLGALFKLFEKKLEQKGENGGVRPRCEKGINVQFIVQFKLWKSLSKRGMGSLPPCIDPDNRTHMILCVDENDLDVALSAIEDAKSKVRAGEVVYRSSVAIVSVFGPHFQDHPGVACAAFSALALAGINILAISTSISTISCLIDSSLVIKTVEAFKEAFDVPSSAIFIASQGLTLRSITDQREASHG